MAEQVRVFISHHHSPDEDRFTARLVADLEAAGADVWVDTGQVSSGNFVQKISEGMEGRQWLILVLTPQSVASPWVRNEVHAALSEHTAGRMLGVIPFVMTLTPEQDIPVLWRQLHRYNATRDYPGALAGMLRALGLPPAPSTADVAGTHAPLPSLSARTRPEIEPRVALAKTPMPPEHITTLPGVVVPESHPKKAPRNTRTRRQTYGILGGLGVTILTAVVLVAVAEYGIGGFRYPSPSATSTPSATNTPFSTQEANIHASQPTKFNPIPFSDTTFSPATGWPRSRYCYSSDSSIDSSVTVYDINTNSDTIGAVCFVPTQEASNASIVSHIDDAAYGNTNDYGYVIRARDDTHYYLFDIGTDSNTWTFYKIDGPGAPHAIVRGTSSLLSSLSNIVIKVQMTGAHFEFFVDSARLGTADDTSYSSGKMGLYAGPNMLVEFSYIAIT